MGQDRKQRPVKPMTYRDAGVDIERQDEALRRIAEMVRSTRTAGVISDLGSFGGLFAPALAGVEQPVLVASCDGVGTKLRVAVSSGIHHTVGRDLVNHCVNDILVQGARPLFFMDYVATGSLEPAVLASVVEGVAQGCREVGCALLGGETAEMPEFYAAGDYDVAGFIVGMVDRERVIDGSRIRLGDRLVALPSAGLHTNGFSLARKIFFEVAKLGLDEFVDELGETVGEALLSEHRCYLQALSEPLDRGWVHGLAHITGGGVVDNVPRILPKGTSARVERERWTVPPVFSFLQRHGNVQQAEMDRTFNMGLGMIAMVGPTQLPEFQAHLDGLGQGHFVIGEIVSGSGKVLYA